MLALSIEFLTGRYVATHYNDRSRPEWPPHPARVFSALVATLYGRDPVDPTERAALEWLQVQGPPEIAASEAAERDAQWHFVWPNDASVFGEDAEQLHTAERQVQGARTARAAAAGRPTRTLRELDRALRAAERERERLVKRLGADSREDITAARRVVRLSSEGRQPRTFPSVTAQEPVVHFIWPTAAPSAATRTALQTLASRVTRLGHSSSLVRCALAEHAPPATWLPGDIGPTVLRVPTPVQLALLDEEYTRHHGLGPRRLPHRAQRYRRVELTAAMATAVPVFGEEWIVYERVAGPPLSLCGADKLARALRATLMRHADEQPPPELISGHTSDGHRSQQPHLAFVALPYVGHPHADATVLGIAAILPRDVSEDKRRQVYRAFARWEREQGRWGDGNPLVHLWAGRAGAWWLRRCTVAESHPRNLDPAVWIGPVHGTRRWGSVTPVILDRCPRHLHARHPETATRAAREAAESIAASCLHINLPRPERVEILPVSPILGAPPAAHFPPFSAHPGEPARVHVHVRIEFPEPVRGPVLLGAGRYRGLGLCRPLGEGGTSA